MQFEQAMSLIETQKLSIKLLQDELGEEAEFDAEETVQMRSIRRECETRVNNYEERMSFRHAEGYRQASLSAEEVTKERDESQQSARNISSTRWIARKTNLVVRIRRWTRCEMK
jgi:hypothetical protein